MKTIKELNKIELKTETMTKYFKFLLLLFFVSACIVMGLLISNGLNIEFVGILLFIPLAIYRIICCLKEIPKLDDIPGDI